MAASMSRRLLRSFGSLYTFGRCDSPSITCQSFHGSHGKGYLYLIVFSLEINNYCSRLQTWMLFWLSKSLFILLITDLSTLGYSGLFKVYSHYIFFPPFLTYDFFKGMSKDILLEFLRKFIEQSYSVTQLVCSLYIWSFSYKPILYVLL